MHSVHGLNLTTIEAILTESKKFEIESKGKINLITRFIATNTRKKQTNLQIRTKQPVDTITLPKIEIAKFSGDPTSSLVVEVITTFFFFFFYEKILQA